MKRAANILIIEGGSDTLDACEQLLSASRATTVVNCSRDAAIHGFFSCRPDVILSELAAPEAGRVKDLPIIRHRHPASKVILLSQRDQRLRDRPSAWANQLGADALLARPFDAARLYAAVEAVRTAPGESQDCWQDGASCLHVCRDGSAARVASLTPREHDVLAGVVAGCPSKVIAYKLGISVRTVELHRGHIMRRLGVKHVSLVVRAAVCAMQRGQYPDPPPAFASLLKDIYNFAQDENPMAYREADASTVRKRARKIV